MQDGANMRRIAASWGIAVVKGGAAAAVTRDLCLFLLRAGRDRVAGIRLAFAGLALEGTVSMWTSLDSRWRSLCPGGHLRRRPAPSA